MDALNFKLSRRSSFLRGIAKGMSAPFMLYGRFTVSIEVPAVNPVQYRRSRAAAQNDWQAVGADIKAAIAGNGKEG